MISKLLRQVTKTQLNAIPKYNIFGFGSKDCFRQLGIKRTASSEEIQNAYRSKLRELQKSMRNQKQINELKIAQDEALRECERRESLNNNNTNYASYQQGNQQNTNTTDSQQFEQSQKKPSWFKTFLQAQNYGQKATKESKTWGMELFGFGILGITALCYVIGSNLTDKSKQNLNGPNVILSYKDMQQSKQNYAEYQTQKQEIARQRQLQAQQQQQQQQQQQSQQDYQHDEQDNSNRLASLFEGKSHNSSGEQKSSFEREFEEYKNKNSGKWKGQDE